MRHVPYRYQAALIRVGMLTTVALLGVGWLVGTPWVSAQDSVSDPTAGLATKVADFLDVVSTGDATQAFESFLANSPLLKQKEGLASLISRSSELETKYGTCHEIEQFDSRRIGSDLVYFRYLFKCETHPVIWHVFYYRDQTSSTTASGTDHWRVISLRFDTDLEALVKG